MALKNTSNYFKELPILDYLETKLQGSVYLVGAY